MKLVWLSLVLSTAGEGVSNSSKSETYAQRAISSWQAKRDQKKKEKEAERDLRRAKRKNERKNKSRNKTKPSDFVTFTDSPLTSPLPSGEGSKSNSNHLNDPRPSDSEYIPNYMSHDEDDILYTPSYAMFMAKSGADISDIPIEAGDKKSARVAGIPGIINLWDKYINEKNGKFQVPYAFEPRFDDWGRKVVEDAFALIQINQMTSSTI